MIAVLDAAYADHHASVACVLARDWASDCADQEYCATSKATVASYMPGQFYKRELPLLLDILGAVTVPVSMTAAHEASFDWRIRWTPGANT